MKIKLNDGTIREIGETCYTYTLPQNEDTPGRASGILMTKDAYDTEHETFIIPSYNIDKKIVHYFFFRNTVITKHRRNASMTTSTGDEYIALDFVHADGVGVTDESVVGMTFDEMWEEQLDFQRNFFTPGNISDIEKVKFTKENMLALHRELGEVLAETPWKHHRANPKTYDLGRIHEELVDCFKFLLNLCIIWEMDESQFRKLFEYKSAIVRERFEAEKDNMQE